MTEYYLSFMAIGLALAFITIYEAVEYLIYSPPELIGDDCIDIEM